MQSSTRDTVEKDTTLGLTQFRIQGSGFRKAENLGLNHAHYPFTGKYVKDCTAGSSLNAAVNLGVIVLCLACVLLFDSSLNAAVNRTSLASALLFGMVVLD